MFAGLIIVITDGNLVRMVEQAGFRSTYLRDTERSNNFVMGMISVCLRKWSRFVTVGLSHLSVVVNS